jgi:hypothetical protein
MEIDELDKMTNKELVAYWNILQFNGRCIQVGDTDKNARHTQLVDELLTKRSIPHQMGKLTTPV